MVPAIPGEPAAGHRRRYHAGGPPLLQSRKPRGGVLPAAEGWGGMTGLSGNHRHSLPGADDIYLQQLPNGITVLARANVSSPSIYLSGYFLSVILAEPEGKLGLAD